MASDILAQTADLSLWHNIFIYLFIYVLAQGLNLIFAQRSTRVSCKFLLATWKASKIMRLPTRGSRIWFHTGVELMAAFPSTFSVLGIANNILLTWELKFPYTNALSIII